MKDYFLNRKTCRLYTQEPIPTDKINDIIFKASKAPTCGNMQLYSVVVTENHEMKQKLAKYHYNQPASEAPVILTICVDFNRFTKWCRLRNADAGYNNFHSFLMGATDAIIFAQQIVTIAEMEGLGTCYLGTVTYNSHEISALLQLPDLVIPIASLSLGYPAQEGEKTDRLSPEAIIHYESYRNLSDEELIDIYKIQENNPENQKFIIENNKENLAQVFAEVRYPRSVNEQISKDFIDLLKVKGFLDK